MLKHNGDCTQISRGTVGYKSIRLPSHPPSSCPLQAGTWVHSTLLFFLCDSFPMASSWILRLAATAALLLLSVADSDGVCYSYGVDFVDEGNYFINSNSNETFTCVSTFEGCAPGEDPAEILFVDPNGDEFICSEVQTTPSNTSMVSTCPFMKDQMISGHNIILVFGNNNGGEPFAWQRGQYHVQACSCPC